MIPTLQELIGAVKDPQAFHSMAVHLPVAAVVLGLVLTGLLLVGRGRWAGVRWSLVGVYGVAAAAAWLAQRAGHAAYHELETRAAVTAAALETMQHHQELGDRVAWLLLGAAALGALTAVRGRALRAAALVLLATGSLGVGGYVAVTAHHGGTLVYAHGAGVPPTPNNLEPGPVGWSVFEEHEHEHGDEGEAGDGHGHEHDEGDGGEAGGEGAHEHAEAHEHAGSGDHDDGAEPASPGAGDHADDGHAH